MKPVAYCAVVQAVLFTEDSSHSVSVAADQEEFAAVTVVEVGKESNMLY